MSQKKSKKKTSRKLGVFLCLIINGFLNYIALASKHDSARFRILPADFKYTICVKKIVLFERSEFTIFSKLDI